MPTPPEKSIKPRNMSWWDFIVLLVGTHKFDQSKCSKCGISFEDYNNAGIPHNVSVSIPIEIPYGTLITNGFPVVCERCYGRFLILVAEWFQSPVSPLDMSGRIVP